MKNENLSRLEGKQPASSSRSVSMRDISRTKENNIIPRIQTLRGDVGGAVTTAPVCGMTNAASGFTLIELLVVVLIIGILAAVALPQYQKAVEKTRLSEAIATMQNVKKAVDLWLLDNGGFPNNTIELLGETTGGPAQRLDIDIESVYPCLPGAGDGCVSPYFIYDSYCRPTKCNIIAERYHSNYSDVSYKLLMRKIPSSDEWVSYCQGLTTSGKTLCNSLSGWIADEELSE